MNSYRTRAHGKAVAAIGWLAEGLFGGHVAGGAVVVDGLHAALELDPDAEIAQGRPVVGKQENVVRRHITMDQPLGVGVGQAVQHLADDADDAADAHRPRAVAQRAGGQFGGHDGVAVDNIDIFNRHQMRMAKLRQQPHFAQDGFIVPFAGHVGQRDFQGDPDTLQRIPCLPDLTIAALAQPLLQAVFSDALFGVQLRFLIPGCLCMRFYVPSVHFCVINYTDINHCRGFVLIQRAGYRIKVPVRFQQKTPGAPRLNSRHFRLFSCINSQIRKPKKVSFDKCMAFC